MRPRSPANIPCIRMVWTRFSRDRWINDTVSNARMTLLMLSADLLRAAACWAIGSDTRLMYHIQYLSRLPLYTGQCHRQEVGVAGD